MGGWVVMYDSVLLRDVSQQNNVGKEEAGLGHEGII